MMKTMRVMAGALALSATPVLLAGCGDGGSAPGDLGADAAPTRDAGIDDLPVDRGARDAGAPTTSEVRVLNLPPTAGGVDVLTDGVPTPLFDLRYPSSTRPVFVPAATYDLALAPTGEGVAAALIELPAFPLGAGTAWSFVAYGALADGRLPVLVIEEDYASPGEDSVRPRVAHVAQDLGVVDAYATLVSDDTLLADSLAEGASQVRDLGASLLAAPEGLVVIIRGGGLEDARFPIPASAVAEKNGPASGVLWPRLCKRRAQAPSTAAIELSISMSICDRG